MNKTEQKSDYILPSALIAKADIARLVREVEALDGEFETQKVRDHKTEETYNVPAMSKGLADFLEANEVKILNAKARVELIERLRVLKDKAPVVHLVFAVEADPEFLSEIAAYIRKEIHPSALITIGIQPSLVGGMYMRTPNRVHDFSLRALLAGKRNIIINELDGLIRGGGAKS